MTIALSVLGLGALIAILIAINIFSRNEDVRRKTLPLHEQARLKAEDAETLQTFSF